MRSIRAAVSEPLQWSQPSATHRAFELRSGTEVLATLRWEKIFGSLAMGECADGQWTFKRSGFLNPKVTARTAGTESEVAVFDPTWKGDGTVQLTGGRRYRWYKPSFWGSEWSFAGEDETVIATFKPRGGFIRHAADVTLAPNTTATEIALLVMLGWYLMVLMSSDASGAAAAGAAAAAG